ncbi:hypothetical protein Fcan01_24497 [Folsomia candida]|uniref:Uncharacterized protein n=1 Tax=Folsomia candida TaxID=158441 RepID=A0A226D7H9_FOLCA|nr:hypothetical protein Fcan01_24497 [Folsomia candida]
MPLPWKPNGVLGVAQLLQNLWIEKYPFGNTFPYKLCVENGMFYAKLEHGKYNNLYKLGTVLCLIWVSITCGFGSILLISISTSWMSVFKTTRLWLWSGMSLGCLTVAGMHCLVVYDPYKVILVTFRELGLLDLQLSEDCQKVGVKEKEVSRNNVAAMATVVWFEALVDYYLTPLFHTILMIFDLEPGSYFLQYYKLFEYRGYIMSTLLRLAGGSEVMVRSAIWFLRYCLALLYLYECLRTILIMIIILTNYINILIRFRHVTTLLVSKYCELVDISKFISLYRIANIIILILEPAFNVAFLPGFCSGGALMVGIAYFFIRRHNYVTMYTSLIVAFFLMTFTLFINQVFEALADVHHHNVVVLQLLKGDKIMFRFVSSHGRREFGRRMKALKPWGIPLGIGYHTFFLVKRTNKMDAAQGLMDATVTMLLTN